MNAARRTAVIAGLGVGSIALATLVVALLGDGGDGGSTHSRVSVRFGGLGYGGFGLPAVRRKTSVHVFRDVDYAVRRTTDHQTVVVLAAGSSDVGIDHDRIEAVLNPLRGATATCYHAQTSGRDADGGTVSLDFTIQGDGSARIDRLDGGAAAARHCVRQAVSLETFPSAPDTGGVGVHQDFVFRTF